MSATDAPEPAVEPRQYSVELRRGFLAIVPLWLGIVPFAITFALLARAAGFDLLTTQACSALIFAGAAQVAIVTLAVGGAGPVVIVLTAILLNLRHVLYGLSLGARLPARTRPPRPLLALLLTDEVYGVTIRALAEGRGSGAFLFGAGLSVYAAFNLATLAGALAGRLLPDPAALGLDFIFPLTFLALLLPSLRARRDVLVAAVAGGVALLLSRYVPEGVTILISALVAASLGAALSGQDGVDG